MPWPFLPSPVPGVHPIDKRIWYPLFVMVRGVGGGPAGRHWGVVVLGDLTSATDRSFPAVCSIALYAGVLLFLDVVGKALLEGDMV